MASGNRFAPYTTSAHHNPLFDGGTPIVVDPNLAAPRDLDPDPLAQQESASGPIRTPSSLRAADLTRFNHQPLQPIPADDQASETGSFDWDREYGHLPPASDWGDDDAPPPVNHTSQTPEASTSAIQPPAPPRESSSQAVQPTTTPSSSRRLTAPSTPNAARPRPPPARSGYIQAPAPLLRTFTTASTQAGLDDFHNSLGLKYLDSQSREDSLAGKVLFELEISQRLHGKLDKLLVFMAGAEEQKKKQALDLERQEDLKNFLYGHAVRLIASAELGAYTAQEDANGPIPTALFNLLLKKVLKAPALWRERVLGPTYVYQAKPEDIVYKKIGDIAKSARSALSTKALLHTGLPAHSNGSDHPVPHEDSMIFNIRGKLKTTPEGCYFNREEVNEATDHATRARLVCVRSVLCEFHIHKGRFPGLSNWGAVEAMINDLNRESPRYRLCFATLAIEDDLARFTGKRTMVEVKKWMSDNGVSWGLPTRERVADMMAALELKFGDRPVPLELLYQAPMLPLSTADQVGGV